MPSTQIHWEKYIKKMNNHTKNIIKTLCTNMDVSNHPNPLTLLLKTIKFPRCPSSRDRWEASASLSAGAANESLPSWQIPGQQGRAQEATATSAIATILTQK